MKGVKAEAAAAGVARATGGGGGEGQGEGGEGVDERRVEIQLPLPVSTLSTGHVGGPCLILVTARVRRYISKALQEHLHVGQRRVAALKEHP